VEKQLKEHEGVTREEIGREAFIERTWQWKRKYGSYITEQLRRLGASCDWDRERFTFDEGLSAAVREAFVRLYRLGLIYQGEYLVNWSPGLQTAVSDLEVEYQDEPGQLYYFKYPVAGGGHIPVATTRPETILGDTAVAVHPDDERYAEFIGRSAIVPVLDREIPVIADKYVDMSFGTGALKVTPGHDPNDFEIGQRHGLQIVNVMNKDATMSSEAGPYEGLDRFECRERLWADMEKSELTLKVEPYTISVPHSQRGGEIIEPMVSRQWFVNAKPMAQMGLAAVRSGRIKIVPNRFEKVWENWLENIRPWCISRQLWWGHRIPVWYCDDCSQLTVTKKDPELCQACGSSKIKQDPDVLDTWFSSALWPFSTLGWPEETADLEKFYPTDVLETGYDILFFWVARMVMAGAMFTNNIPFHTIYLHGLVRDEHGKKMSKSAGNVVDPLKVIEQYGTDALRFTLLTGGTPGNDLNLSLAKVASNRNFANKIWNLARFVVHSLENFDAEYSSQMPDDQFYSVADRWILTRLSDLVEDVDRLADGYQYGEAGRQVYDFLWGDFADWYVELAKVQLGESARSAAATMSTLLHVLDSCLRLLHPYIPYVTEETWQQLKQAFDASKAGSGLVKDWPEALIVAEWPSQGRRYQEEAADFERLQQLVRAIRSIRSEYNVEPAKRIAAMIAAGDRDILIQSQRPILTFLARLDDSQTTISVTVDVPEDAVTIPLGDITIYLPLAGMVDLEKERSRLQSELAQLDEQHARLTKLLASEFAQKAPVHVVDREREKLVQIESGRTEVADRLSALD
jgi:valyl-tRNA synthetase